MGGTEFYLKLLIASLFLPEGLSFYIGDFRLSLTRVLLIVLFVIAALRLSRRSGPSGLVRIPSDNFVLAAGAWMLFAATVTGGFSGFKGAGIQGVEFAGAYFAFRYLTPSQDGAVRIAEFACKMVFVIVGVALLDPLTGKLFTYETVKALTGYVKPSYESALAAQAETMFRNGSIRAMGPLEHSILFGAVCAWLGGIALLVPRSRFLSWSVAAVALFGIWISQARAPLLAFAIAIGLILFYRGTKSFRQRWKILGGFFALFLLAVFAFSGSPIATLMKLAGIGPEAAWYRQAIWGAAVPLVLQSPLFGLGVGADWDWQSNSALIGDSVDAFWLRAAMMFGLPGVILIFLTMAGAFWRGPIDTKRCLSPEERRLSVALGIVTVAAVFLGFTVHFWGTTWIMLGIFPGLRANLAEAAIRGQRMAAKMEMWSLERQPRATPS